MKSAVSRDDCVEPTTRAVALVVAVAVFLGFGVLYVYTERIPELWAWPVKPPTTALLMGSGYLAGCYFFVRVLFARRWHEVSLGFVPVTVFASAMLVATLLHWDRFQHAHITFRLWLVLYAAAPLLVPVVWWLNQRRDPGRDAGAPLLPRALRIAMIAASGAQLLFVLWMFVRPETVIPWWPWKITPLTARVVASFYSLLAVIAVTVAIDGRLSSARIPLHSALVGLVLMLVALPRIRADVNPANPLALASAAGLLLLVGGLAALLVWIDRRLRRAAPPLAATA